MERVRIGDVGELLPVEDNQQAHRALAAGERAQEQTVFGRGFDNGLVTIARRLMATGLPIVDDTDKTNV